MRSPAALETTTWRGMDQSRRPTTVSKCLSRPLSGPVLYKLAGQRRLGEGRVNPLALVARAKAERLSPTETDGGDRAGGGRRSRRRLFRHVLVEAGGCRFEELARDRFCRRRRRPGRQVFGHHWRRVLADHDVEGGANRGISRLGKQGRPTRHLANLRDRDRLRAASTGSSSPSLLRTMILLGTTRT